MHIYQTVAFPIFQENYVLFYCLVNYVFYSYIMQCRHHKKYIVPELEKWRTSLCSFWMERCTTLLWMNKYSEDYGTEMWEHLDGYRDSFGLTFFLTFALHCLDLFGLLTWVLGVRFGVLCPPAYCWKCPVSSTTPCVLPRVQFLPTFCLPVRCIVATQPCGCPSWAGTTHRCKREDVQRKSLTQTDDWSAAKQIKNGLKLPESKGASCWKSFLALDVVLLEYLIFEWIVHQHIACLKFFNFGEDIPTFRYFPDFQVVTLLQWTGLIEFKAPKNGQNCAPGGMIETHFKLFGYVLSQVVP